MNPVVEFLLDYILIEHNQRLNILMKKYLFWKCIYYEAYLNKQNLNNDFI